MKKPIDRKSRDQGMNWIRKEKRLAIYLRDDLSCCYCGKGVVDGVQLTLDHIVPHSKGGANEASNLVTACKPCNSSRGNKPVSRFACKRIVFRIVQTVTRPIDVKAALTLMHRSGGFVAACAA